MIRLRMMLIAVVLALCAAGCTAKIDRQIKNVNTDGRKAVEAFGDVALKYVDAAESESTSKHLLWEQHVKRDWDDFLRQHTSDDGRLVSVAADGTVQPMMRADLEQAMVLRNDKLMEVERSKQASAAIHGPFRQAVADLKAMVHAWERGEESAVSAKESAQALWQSTLSAIGGLAAGAGVAAAP